MILAFIDKHAAYISALKDEALRRNWVNKKPRCFQRGLLKILGWEMGLEPTTTGITIRDSTN